MIRSYLLFEQNSFEAKDNTGNVWGLTSSHNIWLTRFLNCSTMFYMHALRTKYFPYVPSTWDAGCRKHKDVKLWTVYIRKNKFWNNIWDKDDTKIFTKLLTQREINMREVVFFYLQIYYDILLFLKINFCVYMICILECLCYCLKFLILWWRHDVTILYYDIWFNSYDI